MSDNIKDEILKKKIDEDQLGEITGGGSADGKGGCEANYYAEDCLATVEAGSSCTFSHDYCDFVGTAYTQPGGCAFAFRADWEDGKNCNRHPA